MHKVNWFLSTLFFFAATALPAQSPDFSGRYAGVIEGVETRLELKQDGNRVLGTVTSDDYIYQLQATRTGNQFSGQLLDPQMGSSLQIEGRLDSEILTLVLLITDSFTGQTQKIEQAFQRFTEGEQAPGPPSSIGGPLGALGSSAGWVGSYSGSINNTPTTLTLQQQGDTVTGKIDSGGYLYELSGSAQGQTLSGTVRDPQTGGSFKLEGNRNGNALTLTLLVSDPNSGQTKRTSYQFQRGALAASKPGQNQSPNTSDPDANVQRDSSLVGRWRNSESMSSGDFSMVTEKILVINPDGTYMMGDGRVVGGGGAGGFDSGGGGGVEAAGHWKTENRIVFSKEQGSSQWVPYARYYVETNKLMFTFGDGSREIWYRQ